MPQCRLSLRRKGAVPDAAIALATTCRLVVHQPLLLRPSSLRLCDFA
jgi:hypothetical protein